MSKPPKIVIPGLNLGIGVPPGYVLGRMPGTGKGPAQLLNMGSLRKLGVAGASGVAQSTSTAISTAHSENVSLKTSVSTSLSQISSSLSGAVSSTGSLSTAVSTVISGSISAANSRIDSLSTAVGGGGGVDDDTALSTSLSSVVSVNTTQSTSLSQISSSLSGAISSTSSLSSAVSTVDSNQSTSLSQISSSLSAEISTDLSRINSLSTAVGGGGGGGGTFSPLEVRPPVASAFGTTFNSPTLTDHAKIGLHITGASGGTVVRCAVKTLSGDKTIIARIIASVSGANTSAGICIRNSTSAAVMTIGPTYNGSFVLNCLKWTNVNTASADLVNPKLLSAAVWIKVVYTASGTSLNAYMSNDGYTWITLFTANTFVGAADQVGIYVWSTTSGTGGEPGSLITYYDDGTADAGTQLVLSTP